MMTMMERCWNWMMSLGAAGMLFCVLLLVAAIALVVWLVLRLSR